MMFPAGRRTADARIWSVLGVLTLLLTPAFLAPTASRANPVPPPPPVLKNVKYTLTAQNPIYAEVYYLDQEPGNFAEWSNNTFRFTPNIEVDVGPNQPWVYELQLEQPENWAMFSASTGPEPGEPNFHCELTVDGVVVVERDGPTGVLCSIRAW